MPPPTLPPVHIATLPHFKGLPLPEAATAGSAGLDLMAAIAGDIEIQPNGRVRIPTGLKLVIPAGYEGQIRPRSGLAFHHGITLVNGPATIDSDYRGEIQVLMINLGDKTFTITHGMRIAQLLIAPVISVRFNVIDAEEMEAKYQTARGSGGFGSSGYHAKNNKVPAEEA